MRRNPIYFLLAFIRYSGGRSTVSFKNIPACTHQSCFPFHSSSIGCSSFTIECFCYQSLGPLHCAYNSCNSTEWFAVEDWFAGVCPNPPVVDFQPLPDCGRACVRSELEANGCPADYSESSSTAQFNRNCFCRLESNATLQQNCLAAASCNDTASQAQDTLNLLYQQNCVYAQDNSGQNDVDTTGDQVVQSASSSGGSINSVNLWLSILGSIVALILFTSGVMAWVKRVVSLLHTRFGFMLMPLSAGMQERPEG
jgi:hypothetical protein